MKTRQVKNYEDLTFSDNFIFYEILKSNPDLCKEIVETILDVKIREIVNIDKEDTNITINASDDGINAGQKVNDYTPTIEINGGNITVNMAMGDTDALDSNGYLYINGGVVNISAQFAFDYDWGGEITGGEVYVNGQQVTVLTNSMMGGPGGGRGGGRP